MKLGLSAHSFPANMTVPQGLKLAKRSGFDCVELSITESGYLGLNSDIEAVRRSVENMSLEVASVRLELPSYSIGLAKDSLRICAGLGTHILVLPLQMLPPQQIVADIAELADLAAENDVTIGVDGFPCESLKSVADIACFIDSIGRKNVGFYLDTGAVASVDAPEKWIAKLSSRAKLIRVRDYDACGKISNLLSGELDWKAIKRAIDEIGYNGAVIADVPGYRQFPELGIKHCGEQMKRIFK